MRCSLLFCVTLAPITFVIAAPMPPTGPREIPQLIAQLGSEDFAEREVATRRLDALGSAALAELRAATGSENPEIAGRAKDLVGKIEYRAANERVLTPTVVELNLKDAPLDAVLAALSKQIGCEVVLGGSNANELAGKKVSVATGRVPFWVAVQKVCDAGELQVAGAGGFVAPGVALYNARPGRTADGAPVRVARDHNLAVILEARAGHKRPASVHGSVMIESFELPKGAAPQAGAAAIVQVWPEPKLGWQENTAAKVTHAIGSDGRKLVPDFSPNLLPQVQRPAGGKLIVVRRPDGSVVLVNPDATNPLEVGPSFAPNVRQSLLVLKTGAGTATELNGAVFGLVRAGPEPLAVVALGAGKPTTVRGRAGVELTATVRNGEKGKTVVDVKIGYEARRVQPARQHEELVGAEMNAAGSNSTVFGVRITDADGRAFNLGLLSERSAPDPTGRQVVARLTLEPLAARDAPAVPATVTFWGSYTRPVEVPFALTNVPLSGGGK